MEPLRSGGPGLVLECPSLPARTCLGVDSSVQQQRLWKKMGVRGGKVSSFSGRRQRPVTRTGWVRTYSEARISVRTPTTQVMLGENGGSPRQYHFPLQKGASVLPSSLCKIGGSACLSTSREYLGHPPHLPESPERGMKDLPALFPPV